MRNQLLATRAPDDFDDIAWVWTPTTEPEGSTAP